MTQIIIQGISFIFVSGIMYGAFNSRLKQIEKTLNESKDTNERLARIEEQTKIIINHFINNKKNVSNNF